jgi:PilZ domain
MEKRAAPRKPVLMSGAIEFAGSVINCLISNISISGAALEVTSPHDIPERFDLVFRRTTHTFPVMSSGAKRNGSASPSTKTRVVERRFSSHRQFCHESFSPSI